MANENTNVVSPDLDLFCPSGHSFILQSLANLKGLGWDLEQELNFAFGVCRCVLCHPPPFDQNVVTMIFMVRKEKCGVT